MGSFTSEAPCREADPWLFDQFNLDLAQPEGKQDKKYEGNALSVLSPLTPLGA